MSSALRKRFRKQITENAVIGTFSKTEDPAVIEALGYAGLDFVIIDLEHGPNSVRSCQNLIRAAEISGIVPLVRVKEGAFPLISEVLDIGAAGVQIPQIESVDSVNSAIGYVKFHPEGARGICRFVRAASYSSKERNRYFAEASDTIVIVQIEGQEGIDSLDAILEETNVDVIFIGPYDLSQSLGVPGKIEDERVVNAMKDIINRCLAKGVMVGTFVDTFDALERWKSAGVRYIAYSVDLGIMYQAASDIKATFDKMS